MDYEQLGQALQNAYGDSIAEPKPARLGNPALDSDQDRIKVPLTETDQAGMVYIYNVVGEDDGVTQALNSGPGKLSDRDLIYGRYILVKKVGRQYVIHGVDYQADAEYIYGVALPNPGSIKLGQLDWGLLQPTFPTRSMRALVSLAVYDGDKLVQTQETIDFTSEIPAGSGDAVAVLVTVNPTTSALTYTVGGSEFDETLSHADAFDDFYPVNADPTLRTVGWLKLINGMSAITEGRHIFASQQPFSGGSGSASASASVVAEGTNQSVSSGGGVLEYDWGTPDFDNASFWAGGSPHLLNCADQAVYMASASVHLEWLSPPTGGEVIVRITDDFSAIGWVADWKQDNGTQESIWLTVSGGRYMDANSNLTLYIENNSDAGLDVYARITVAKQ